MQSLNVKSLADDTKIISVNILPGDEDDTIFFFFLVKKNIWSFPSACVFRKMNPKKVLGFDRIEE